METTVGATFGSSADARNAISDLCTFGLNAADISVAETEAGVGTVFGTAQTLSPGRGAVDISTVVQPNYPQWAGGGMPAGIVAQSADDVHAGLLDAGLSESDAIAVGTALFAGAVFLTVTVAESVAKATAAILERNEGTVLREF